MKSFVKASSTCVACLLVPACALLLGLLAIQHPLSVLFAAVVGALAMWATLLATVAGTKTRDIDGRRVAAASAVLISAGFGFAGGMLAGAEHTIDLPVLLIAFSLGLGSGVLFQKRGRLDLGEVGILGRREGAAAVTLRGPELVEAN